MGKPGPALLGLASIERHGGFRRSGFDTYGGDCSPRILLKPGDLYVSLKDVTQSADVLGAVARIPRDIPSGRLTQDTVGLIPKDSDTPWAYLYWLLRTPQYRNFCWRYSTGTTTLGLAREDFLAYPVPALTEQRESIVVALDLIEARLEALEAQSKTFECLTKAVFKSWFVAFDPVRAKAEGREPEAMDAATAALFPSEFSDSRLGIIPQGWCVRKVEELADKVGMGPFGSSIKVETFVPTGVPVISGNHLRTFLLEDSTHNFIKEDHAQKLVKANVFAGDIVFTHAGNIGNVSLIPENPRYPRYVISQRQFFMRCNLSEITPRYVILFFASDSGRHRLLANASSVGVPSIARPVTYLRSLELLVPPRRILERFDDVVCPLFRSIERNRKHIDTLSEIRDTLLPRLISGKLRVPEAEKMMEAVL